MADLSSGIVAKFKVATCKVGLSKAFGLQNLAEMVVDGCISRYAILEVTDYTGVWVRSHNGSDVPTLAIITAKFVKRLTHQIVDSKHAVNELSTTEFTPYLISELIPGCYDFTISAMVTSKPGVEKSNGATCFDVILRDNSGEIRGVAFGGLARRFGKAFELGKSYLISNADVHWGNTELTKNKKTCELVLSEPTTAIACSEQPPLPQEFFDFVPLASLVDRNSGSGSGYYSRGSGNAGQTRGGGGGNSYHRGGSGGHHHQGGHDDRDNKEKKKRDAIFDLKKYTNKSIRVKFMGGREVVGFLKGSDQLLNIVLDDAKETIRASEDTESSETKVRHIGLVVLRGPSIILVSPTDGSEEIENPFVQTE
ncbi:U6 snRNP-associated protein Lsm7 [Coemansia sp. BCRC 34301]|nr:U6 snRNP-associated protein Lsm7 [Coemansia sp. BCRC 34301]